MGGYKPFRRFRQGRGGGGVALCDWEFGLSGLDGNDRGEC